MLKENVKIILGEIATVLSRVHEGKVTGLITEILTSKKIVTIGAGRVGLAIRGFAMRLTHLGLEAHMIGDATVPSIAKGDLLIVASGSGETQTIYDLLVIAKKNKTRVALITGNNESKMGKLADYIIILPAPTKTKVVNGSSSVQPMTTLNEQCLVIFFDAVVLELMNKLGETHDTMWARHSNLE